MAHRGTPFAVLLVTVACFLGTVRLSVAQSKNLDTGKPSPSISEPHPNSAATYRIAGVVVSKVDGHTLSRARVMVGNARGGQTPIWMITAEDGRFQFPGLPAGKYSLAGAKRGFVTSAYDQHDQFSTAIVTGAGLDTENLVLKLSPDAVISGKVLDEAGEAVRHATVTLYSEDHRDGVDQIRAFGNAQTDDQGNYEITPLAPGTYFLSADARPWYAVHPQPAISSPGSRATTAAVDRSLDVAYSKTYYPDVTEADSAMPIPVRGGEHVPVDIHLNPVPALSVIFHVPGGSKNGPVFPRLEQPAFDSSSFVQAFGGRMISSDVLEISGIPAGRYNIRTQAAGSGTQMNNIDLSKDGEVIDTSRGEALGSIKISVQVQGESAIPKDLSVWLRAKGRVAAVTQNVDAKGEAELQQIPPGKYEVEVVSRTALSIARIAAEGAEVSGRTLILMAGASASASLTLSLGSAEIEGTVERAGKGFAGAMVVLVPKNPEDNRDLFRRDQSDLDGSFTLHRVLPGSYTLLAIENGWDLDWSRPEVIAVYAKQGRPIEVTNHAAQPWRIPDAVAVQPK